MAIKVDGRLQVGNGSWLSINLLSDNVGCVKQVLGALRPCTQGRAPFRSIRKSAKPNQGSLAIVLGQELGPTHPSLRSATAIMITDSDSPEKGAGCPINISVSYCTP